jgi:hypothetical protein
MTPVRMKTIHLSISDNGLEVACHHELSSLCSRVQPNLLGSGLSTPLEAKGVLPASTLKRAPPVDRLLSFMIPVTHKHRRQHAPAARRFQRRHLRHQRQRQRVVHHRGGIVGGRDKRGRRCDQIFLDRAKTDVNLSRFLSCPRLPTSAPGSRSATGNRRRSLL